jgi:cbb3-type cytochrome oxidase maturation protein
MTILVILMPVAILLGVGFIAAFVISVRSGQYDDLDTPAHRILLDDVAPDECLLRNKTEKECLINKPNQQSE